MTFITDKQAREMLAERAPDMDKQIDEMSFGEFQEWVIVQGDKFTSLLTIDSIEKSVEEDRHFLKTSPLVRKDLRILGYSLDMATGQLSEVHPGTRL